MKKEIVVAEPIKELATISTEQLIARAIDKQVPVETMERLLAMAKEMQAIKAKQEFNKAMAAFQSECPTIQKTREVKTNSGQIAYKYAPIESIVEQVKEALQRNGFSYSTNMELLETGVKVFVKVTHLAGHSEVTEMNVPLGNKTAMMSQTQLVAAAQTFAKRYAFCNALGILTGDEDTDARIAEVVPDKPKTYQAPKEIIVPEEAKTEPTDEKDKFAIVLKKMDGVKDLKTAQTWLKKLESSDKLSDTQKRMISGILKAKIKLYEGKLDEEAKKDLVQL